MSDYMRNLFPFLGIGAKLRQDLCRGYFEEAAKSDSIDWDFVDACWENKYRELQYVAVSYLELMNDLLTPDDIPKLKALALMKSWWDTIDGLDHVVGNVALRCPEVNDTILEWSKDENMWLRRIAIDHQILRKENTDTELLEKVIVNNFGQDEYFISRAIGWSLRSYSKYDPQWVKDFIDKYRDQMDQISITEASRYI